MYIHTQIYNILCDKDNYDDNMKIYIDHMNLIKNEINDCVSNIKLFINHNDVHLLRSYVHKLINSIIYLDNNCEFFALCKVLLFIDKDTTHIYDILKYRYLVKCITNYNYTNLLNGVANDSNDIFF